MDRADLLAEALNAPRDSPERILYATAAFGSLVDGGVVLVGGAAQVTHTGAGRLTDIDVIGRITDSDERRIAAAGFTKEGRHWVLAGDESEIAIEVPAAELSGIEPPEVIDVEGVAVSVISLNDLMMDRLVQATHGTEVTHDEALQLAVAAHDRIDWASLAERAERVAAAEPFLGQLPALVERFDAESARLHG